MNTSQKHLKFSDERLRYWGRLDTDVIAEFLAKALSRQEPLLLASAFSYHRAGDDRFDHPLALYCPGRVKGNETYGFFPFGSLSADSGEENRSFRSDVDQD